MTTANNEILTMEVMMQTTTSSYVKVGKLPNIDTLGACLREIETEHIENDEGEVEPVRQALIHAIGEHHGKRFALGKALNDYKSCFIAERGWMAAVKTIALAADLDERTVRRFLEDYQRASRVPATAITELEKRKLDPAAKKNEPIIANLQEMSVDMIEADPEAAVVRAIESAKKPRQRLLGSSQDRSATSEKARRQSIRFKIQTALNKVPNEQKLEELRLAVEEEMYVWGMTEPIEIIFTPRSPGSTDVDAQHEPLARFSGGPLLPN